LRAEGFFCNLDVLYGGLGIDPKKTNKFSYNFFQFLVIKALDPFWIRIGIQPRMLDPDPDEMNADLQPWFLLWLVTLLLLLLFFCCRPALAVALLLLSPCSCFPPALAGALLFLSPCSFCRPALSVALFFLSPCS
jgi:hypothetical protein